ncbi:group III truncated hemoglobin [Alsobacter sp. KACC 23698]|uniref:Group III truncated hemoglobin n=1 Tax=Alsobacter sp. KACC 23698 TaxID=3149229 RepID=A0AAU7JIJ3_9HYPH
MSSGPQVGRAVSPGAAVAIDRTLIRQVVHAFYDKVRIDPLLGPIFDGAVQDWPHHLDRLTEFWSAITLMTGGYKGDPLRAHVNLPKLGDEHFLRWLALFRSTLAEHCTPEQHLVFLSRAERIADSFRFGLASIEGRIAAPLTGCSERQ